MVRSHLLNRSTLSSAIIGVVPKEIAANTSTNSSAEDEDNGMHSIGCAGIVVQVTGTNWPRPAYTLLVTGLCRFRLETVVVESPYLIGLVQQLDKLPADGRDRLISRFDSMFVSNYFRHKRRKHRTLGTNGTV